MFLYRSFDNSLNQIVSIQNSVAGQPLLNHKILRLSQVRHIGCEFVLEDLCKIDFTQKTRSR